MTTIDNTITINDKLKSNMWMENIQTLINSEDFEDLLLVYHMNKWETWVRKNFNSFKKSIWI